jgi:hypothetical protein
MIILRDLFPIVKCSGNVPFPLSQKLLNQIPANRKEAQAIATASILTQQHHCANSGIELFVKQRVTGTRTYLGAAENNLLECIVYTEWTCSTVTHITVTTLPNTKFLE